MENIDSFFHDNSNFVSLVSLDNIGQPYSCNDWKIENSDHPPIVLDDGQGSFFFQLFGAHTYPYMIIIGHDMKIYKSIDSGFSEENFEESLKSSIQEALDLIP